MQLAKTERNKTQLLMPPRTSECGESARAEIKEERNDKEESPVSTLCFSGGQQGMLSLKDHSKVSDSSGAEDGWVYFMCKTNP